LGEVSSAAFTDTGWDVSGHSETVYNYVLVDSLRKELKKPLSYINDWSKKPRTVWYDYYTRLKMLYRTEWFMIFLGRCAESFPTFPWDKRWPDLGRNAQQLEAFREAIPEKLETHSEMAVWFSWESPVYQERARDRYVRLWMTCNYNLVEQGLKRSRFFDYVSTRALESAKVSDGKIVISGTEYRRLVLPYAALVSSAIWKNLKACAKVGVELIFVGPPPSRLWDTGEDIASEFSELLGVARVDDKSYDAMLTSQRPTPSLSDWEPEKADFRLPIQIESGGEALLDLEGDTIGVRRGNLTWFTTLDPREMFYRHVPELTEGTPEVSHYGQGYYRWYASGEVMEAVMVCIAPMYETLHESFYLGSSSFRLEGGAWAVVKISDEGVQLLLADEGTKLEQADPVIG
ncbi:MAG: hypothetical protein ACQKBV_04205, partial [Puniceicoccales bacterium]